MPEPQQELDPNQLGPGVAPQGQPDFSQQFAQTIMQQFLQNTPEEILRKKKEEYFRNLGIQNPNSFGGKLGAALSEAHLKNTATKDNPYVNPGERLSGSATAEFERNAPNLRLEMGQILKDQQEAAKVRQSGDIAKQKADNERQKIADTLQWQMKKAQAGADNVDAKKWIEDRKLKIKEDEAANLNKIVPGFSGLPKQIQEAMVLSQLKQKSPEDYDRLIDTTSNFSNAKAPPSIQKELQTDLFNPERAQKYLTNYTDLRKADALAHPPNSGGSAFRIFQGMGKDENTGDLIQQNSFYDPKNPGAPMIPIQQHPLNNKLIDTDRALKLSEGNYQSAFNIMLDAIQTGKDEEFQGYAAGNPLATKLRALGGLGDGKTSAEASLSAVKNVADMLHARGLTGGGRFPLQLAERLSAASGNQSDSSKSVARAMGALIYAVQDSRKMATDPDYSARQMTPQVQRRIEQEIDKAVNQAARDKKLSMRSNIQLPSLDDIIKTVNTVYPPGSAKGAEDRLRQKYNIGVK